jgi:hypothetical protein
MNHAAEARAVLALANRDVSSNVAFQTGELKADMIAVAQVHATLALVEQQRIANLIALAGLSAPAGFENETYDARTSALMEGLLDSETVPAVPGYGPAGIDERTFIRPSIREGLGL